MFECVDVSVSRNSVVLFQPFSAYISPGSILTLQGASGLGKTSLLHALVGGHPDLSIVGKVLLDGEIRHPGNGLLGQTQTVFQDALLFPHYSVGANVALPISDLPRVNQIVLVRERLAQVGLDGFFDRDPETLSRGQKMRVAIARALIANPRILLLDEPFRALDSQTREQVKRLVFGEIAQKGMVAILVTHQESDLPSEGELRCLMP